MQDVAAYKWLQQRPIEDLEREAVVLTAASRSGLDYNITAASSEAFFAVQIEAAKEIQRYWFDHWQAHGAPEKAADLITVVRPALLDLGEQITAQLGTSQPIHETDIKATGLSATTAARLAAAANQIRFYDNTLARVLDSGMLRVGTTADYQPFSYLDPAQQLVGIDVDMAQDLAQSLGVELELVSTSWPTLMADFRKGRFDIGMSGISINLSRAKTAFFSQPYHTGGKAAIARCEDADRYNSLGKIDSENVRVIVNPGGTNERFVNQNIHAATIIRHPDNLTIFAEIIEQRADVMITDAIEVKVKAHRYAGLCGTLKNKTFSFQEKAYLLPQDTVWQNYVNTWLGLRQGDGTLRNVFIQHHAD
jgi:cyclohexadienyl dehydratase